MRLLLTSLVLLLQAIGSSVAFQIPIFNRKILSSAAARIKKSTPPKYAPGMLRSKLGRLGIPNPNKSSLLSYSKPFKKKKKKTGIKNEKKSNEQILALVTTCCLASCLLQPTVARAAVIATTASFIDPTTMTYDEVPGLGMLLPNNGLTLPGMYGNFGLFFVELLRRKSVAVVALSALLVFGSLARSAYDGFLYWTVLLANCRRLGNLDTILNNAPTVKHVNWDEYSQYKQLNQHHRVKHDHANDADWFEYIHKMPLVGGPTSTPTPTTSTTPLTRKKNSSVGSNMTAEEQKAKDNSMLKEANRFYQEQKHKLHHRVVPAPNEMGYVTHKPKDNKRRNWEEYKRQLNEAQSKAELVETISDVDDRLNIMKNLLTWDDYKHLVSELQDRKNEVNELKQQVKHLNSLMQIEQSIHQAVTTNQAPRVETTPPSKDRTNHELQGLIEKAGEYEEAIQESSLALWDSKTGTENWHQVQDADEAVDLGSGIK